MARGRSKGHHLKGGHERNIGGRKRGSERETGVPQRRQYEEFGEAHPIDDDVTAKRRKVEHIEDDYQPKREEESEDSISSSDEEVEGTDAVSTLLATFNTNIHKAVNSDEEEEDEDEDEEEEAADSDAEDSDITEGEAESGGDSEDDEGEAESGEYSEDDDAVDQNPVSEQDSNLSDEENSIGEDNQSEISSADNEEYEEDVDDGEELQSTEDPFTKHFERNILDSAAEQVADKSNWTHSFQNWSTLGRIKLEMPKVVTETPKLLLLAEEDSENCGPSIAVPPRFSDKSDFNLDDIYIKKAVQRNLLKVNEDQNASCDTSLTDLQKEVLSILTNYSDFYHPEAIYKHWDEMRTAYAVHIVNHLLKAQRKILKHNSKIAKAKAEKNCEDLDTYRDQGYARPKVLVLLPFKHSAYRLIETITTLLMEGKNAEIQKWKRFKEEYGPGEDDDLHEADRQGRAEDFTETFRGDTNEDFKIGLKLTKGCLKLFSDFYNSDIIIASPLALRYIMGNSTAVDTNSDFLTSIEILVLDQADIFLMQNWEHVLVLMEVLNQPPRNIHQLNTDLTRVRLWSLDGHASLYRQTIVLASAMVDHNRALINKCRNFTGRVQVLNPVESGSIKEIVVQAKLVMSRVMGMRNPDTRFNFFIQELLPQLQSRSQLHTLIYIPDYCDYVRLLRYLREDGGVSISTINEYMVGQNSKVAKARSLFFDGKRHYLLYTERFHFYRRYCIKGVRHIVFYDLPTYPHFFSEICNMMVEGNQNRKFRKQHLSTSTVTVLYQRTDLTKVVGVLGSSKAGEVLNASKAVHMCMLGR